MAGNIKSELEILIPIDRASNMADNSILPIWARAYAHSKKARPET
jgi:hypothetical protein